MQIVDVHIHPDNWENLAAPTAMAELMLQHMNRFDVSVSGILGVVDPGQSAQEVTKSNDQTRQTVQAAPDRLYGLCFVNPALTGTEVKAELDRCLAQPEFRGIKLEFDLHCRDPKMSVVMEAAIQYNVPVLHHTWYINLWDYPNPERQKNRSESHDVAWLARRYPEARIVMAHMEGSEFRGILDVEDCPNVWIDTSGAQPFTGCLEYAVSRIGADRILYGSDLFGRSLHSQLGRIYGAKIPESARTKILGENAIKFYGLEDFYSIDAPLPLPITLSSDEDKQAGLLDVNASWGQWPLRDFPYPDLDAFESTLKQAGIRAAWLSSIKAVYAPMTEAADASLQEELSDRKFFSFIKTVNPLLANWRAECEASLKQPGAPVALRLVPNFHNYELELAADEVAAFALDNKLLILIQVRMNDERNQPVFMQIKATPVASITAFSKKFPTLKVIALCASSGELTALSEGSDQLAVETSFLDGHDPLEVAIGKMGAQRVLFGSHAPFIYPESASLKFTHSGASEKDKIIEASHQLFGNKIE